MLGRDLTAKQLNRRIINFDNKLKALQKEARALVALIEDYAFEGCEKDCFNYDEYTFYFKQISDVVWDLSNFDLEDSIDDERY